MNNRTASRETSKTSIGGYSRNQKDTRSQRDYSALKNNLLLKNIEKVRSFNELPHDWNYNGASRIEIDVIRNSIELLKILKIQPQIFPTGRASIQFEYDGKEEDYLEFEIFSNKIECYVIVGNKEREFILKKIEEANNILILFNAKQGN